MPESPAPSAVLSTGLRRIYGLYVWCTLLAVALPTLLLLLLTPGLERRRALTRGAARLILRLAGLPFEVRQLEHLPAGQCVVVANHASYLDGLVMKAALPPRFGFVIKREMNDVPLAGLLLRRIGSEFVERFDRQRGAVDARRVLRSATRGQSFVFFPEGTFSHSRGLLKFHAGAFVTAVRVGCPVVPAVIRGTRDSLPATGVLPRWRRIEVEILAPLGSPPFAADDAVAQLRDRTRAVILARLGEPDLARPASPRSVPSGAGVAND
ncbi:MAG: 1-acyl-sn-glycerol-3-phosphate acyltransferase [Gammaproteobacteria bacterium]|nr:1-acyl-sn-glycerol-3-phosphate acyltransferase [Gammaproteobacteria bacterium]